MKKFLSAIAICSALVTIPTYAQETQSDAVQFEKDTLTILAGEASHVIDIEIADSPDETTQGLMFRESLAENTGMLFDFGEPREPNMWMKNTLIPLDMLFLDQEGTIVAIARNARPHSLKRISPGMAVKGVLELNGGATDRLEIKPGATVRHAIFNNAE